MGENVLRRSHFSKSGRAELAAILGGDEGLSERESQELRDNMELWTQRDAQKTMIKTARGGWFNYLMIALVVVLFAMFFLQRATGIPLLSSLSSDRDGLRSNYSSGNIAMARFILAGLVFAVGAALFKLLSDAKWDFGVFLFGKQMRTAAKMGRERDRMLQRTDRAMASARDVDMGDDGGGRGGPLPGSVM